MCGSFLNFRVPFRGLTYFVVNCKARLSNCKRCVRTDRIFVPLSCMESLLLRFCIKKICFNCMLRGCILGASTEIGPLRQLQGDFLLAAVDSTALGTKIRGNENNNLLRGFSLFKLCWALYSSLGCIFWGYCEHC